MNVLDQEGCPTPLSAFDCVSVYSAPERDRGNINVPLTPGKTYYLEFHNDSLFSSMTTNVDIHVEYDYTADVPTIPGRIDPRMDEFCKKVPDSSVC